MLLMVPFILFTEFVTAFNVIISEIMGFNTDWYTTENRWYEKQLQYEMNRLDRVFWNFDKNSKKWMVTSMIIYGIFISKPTNHQTCQIWNGTHHQNFMFLKTPSRISNKNIQYERY